ncbi:acetyl-CoA carboxylase 1-like [Wolffia australiana]
MGEMWRINGSTDRISPVRHPAALPEVDEFCRALGGKSPIHSILIANNGMAAVKFIRSIRTWAYETFGTEKAILLIAMATPEDMRINAEHIRIADQFVEVPGGTNNNNYANVQLIVEVAEITRVAAVWPGWGHASENPELPDALNAKGIIFLGPPASPMAALGDKIGSSLIAQAAGVPTLPWSGSKVQIPPESCLDSISDEIYRQACVSTTEEAVATCLVVGYPAMIKASWGGGGKGIRKVHNDDEVRALFKQVQGEVPGSPIFIMKVASQSRHLEVQLLCDQHGNVAALHSRDCSVQRRHQKIIEEGPITIAPAETVKELEQGARRLAKCVGYVGVATVEYLYSMDTGEYYFLELNPRLQVEHPVTEWIAEINLPAAQVSVGMGIPLWKIPEIRRFYGMDNGGGYDAWRNLSPLATPFDFDQAVSVKPKGHCVAVRVTSEDPDDGFKPTSGKVQELNFKSKPNVWAYFSVKSGGGIHEFSDSQFGHVFAFGESRALAIANMVLGLKEIQIRGEIRTNVDYTVDLLHASEYRENKIHTGWLDSRIAMRVRAERPPWYLSVVGGALYKASTRSAAMVSDYIGYLQKGQIPPKHLSLINSQESLNIEGSKYTIDLVRGGHRSYKLKMNGSEVEAEIHTLRDGGLLMQLDGNSHVIYAEEEASGTRLLINGRTCLLENDHDPSKLKAETPCKLLRYLVPDGSRVDADTAYAEVEVMKMCMPLLSPASGIIHIVMPEGQAMQAGDLVGRLDLDDLSAVKKAEPYTGSFPPMGMPTAVSGKIHQRFSASLNAARMILAGYEHDIEEVVRDLLSSLDSPELPFLQWQESMSVLATRLPKELRNDLDTKYREFEANSVFLANIDFPSKLLKGVLETHLTTCPEKEKPTQERLIEPLLSLVKSYDGGRESHAHIIIQSLFEEYLSVEELFNETIQADVIERLRQHYKKDLQRVVDIVISHQGVRNKNKLILRLMEALVYPNPAAYREQLIRFSAFSHPSYSELALKASQLLEQTKLSELRVYIARHLSELEMFTEDGESICTPRRRNAMEERMEDLIGAPLAVEDALVALFDHSDHTLQRRVVETYIRRLYQPYLVKGSVRMQWHRAGLIAWWEFSEEHIERRNSSEDPNSATGTVVEKHCDKRWGAMVVIKSLQVLSAAMDAALKETATIATDTDASPAFLGNMLHVAVVGFNNPMSMLQDSGDEDQAQERVHKLAKGLREKTLCSSLCDAGVGIISCIIQRDEGRAPMRHSFHWFPEQLHYAEEPQLRHLEPPLSTFLELEKLKGYGNLQYTPSRDRQWHLYSVPDPKSRTQRMFLRTLVRQPSTLDGFNVGQAVDKQVAELSLSLSLSFTSLSLLRSLMAALDELELRTHNTVTKAEHAHMYLCILREQHLYDLDPLLGDEELVTGKEEKMVRMMLEGVAAKIHEAVGVRMHRLAVCEWEVKLWLDTAGIARGAWRIVVSNVSGHTFTVNVYREVEDGKSHQMVYHSVSTPPGNLHGILLSAQYQPLSIINHKRLSARRSGTTYCYDFPLAFQTALKKIWASSVEDTNNIPGDDDLLKVTELVFAEGKAGWGAPVVPAPDRPPGSNNLGMVAWMITMLTPEFPAGRTIIVICNDVTFRAGSFGPWEDAFFQSVTNLACDRKLPLIYLAANSGARIGAAEEVKSRFQVAWSDKSSPERGFQYIYLTPEDFAAIGSSVNARQLTLPSGETRYVVDTIIGKDDDLGVENLSGSGAIAGAYSRAYKETFTLTYVSGRTVGIGAYLARLGMRCIQRVDQPIILTGFSALNKLLGREVYSSHMQLGGPKVMATNGVVHLTVADDLEGVSAILRWLSFVGEGKQHCHPPADPPERPVEYCPENSCDPRAAIGAIFDRGSFIETLEGWAKTVVTGRAKLGGIAVGVVAVETQTVMQVIPADPGQLDSHERVVPQAGQVWFPDSATKTAQAIMDFNREQLPLFVLANWRGFSGGQRDLFEGILQAGSTIVENLRSYENPVFVYIPMAGELRGGAWVVVDSRINPEQIEMYAEKTAKGNVLEPEGMIEIKFRAREMAECMGRLDGEMARLKAELRRAEMGGAAAEAAGIRRRMREREKKLAPVYTQVATKFAELHDTSFRMKAKGVVKEVVEWRHCRGFFYKRLRRRVAEAELGRKVVAAGGGKERVSAGSAREMIKTWFMAAKAGAWEDDEAFFTWKENSGNYEKQLADLRVRNAMIWLVGLCDSPSNLEALPHGLADLLAEVEPSAKARLVEELKKAIG